MRQPKFTGPKKGMTAFWVGEDVIFGGYSRIRKLDSRGGWAWAFSQYDGWETYFNGELIYPCWANYWASISENIKEMERYDFANGRKTIFLGYVRDSE